MGAPNRRARDAAHSADRLTPDRVVVIDLFAGCGGGSLGFAAVGFRPVGAVEIDAATASAYEANLRLAPIVRDVRNVAGADLLAAAGLQRGDCTLLFGCPPCQSFTVLRHGSDSTPLDRVRNALPREYLRLVRDVFPRHIAFENVSGILRGAGKRRFDELLAGLDALGYETTWGTLDAADFGVPQRRARVVLIGSRVAHPTLPSPTHGPAGSSLAAHRTVRAAIGSLPRLASGERAAGDVYHRARRHSPIALERLRAIPAGGSRSSLPEDLVLRCHKEHSGHYDIYGRMSWDSPAPTLTSGCTNVTRGRFAHPEQHRAITLREALRLQGFPDTTQLGGTGEKMAAQVGNAVPPPLAEAIGRTVLAMERASRAAPEESVDRAASA
jgi:DNA (cytosine-5)-methyltransferase 1